MLSEYLAASGIRHTICVATEYGEIVLKPHPLAEIHQGRMDREQITAYAENFAAVIDATHPFARDITTNIKAALAGSEIPYFRLKRECALQQINYEKNNLTYFETNEACAKALEQTKGNILLTTGSKELSKYCITEQLRQRLYVRVLPSVESLTLCMEQGIQGKQIFAMQGPFSVEMNEALLKQYHISSLVTKESGVSGGYPEKLAAAERTGTRVFVIGCPKEEDGYSFQELCEELEKIVGIKKSTQDNKLEIILAGIGMGGEGSLTKEVEEAVCKADVLLGAERMLKDLHTKAETHPYYQAEQIIPYLYNLQKKRKQKAVILFSGDSGFYSGCQSLYTALTAEVQEKRLDASIHILPGISSVAYLASCIGECYHDAAVYSIHGKKLCNLVHRVKCSSKTFLLTSGVGDINWLGRQLSAANMLACEVIIGYQLSYENQQIKRCTPLECCELNEEGLYTCLVKNPHPENRQLAPGMSDEIFLREKGKIPMTKEEVREVSICKLHLCKQAVVYDIGSGTGSIAVEIASLCDDLQVYAIERKKEAVSLIEKNRDKFGLQNIFIIEETAPEGLPGLPAPTHVFIGGSGGRLKEILDVLLQMNVNMRIVINAVSIETICEIKEILETYPIEGEEIVQLQTNRIRQAGSYHLMQSENPVWICAFDLCADPDGRAG